MTTDATLPPASKLTPIRNGRGEVTGHIRLYWSPGLGRYVSIPGYEETEAAPQSIQTRT
jgi:hypothetical protein